MRTILLTFSALLILTLIGCFAPIPLYEPSNGLEYKGKYAAYFEPDEKEIYSWYHFVITRNQKGKYIKRTFYPEIGKMTSKVTYNDPSGLIANGSAQIWWDNGNLQSSGNYKQNKKEGSWRHYSPNGNLREVGDYIYNKREGIWALFDDAGRIAEKVHYDKNQKSGKFIQYDTLGNFINEGIYEDNFIVKQTRKDKIERIEPYIASCEPIPDLKTKLRCSEKKLLEYLLKHLKYPKKAIKYIIDGTAYTSFYIEKDGSITDIEVLIGLNDDIKQECIRVVSNLPKLMSGRVNGENERMQMVIPLKFNAPRFLYDY